MKNTFPPISISLPILFLSSEKNDKEKAGNFCPVVAPSMVPLGVKYLFALRYTATNVTTWFNKDSVAFCTYFTTSSNIEKLSEFSNSRSFIRDQIETHQDGQRENSTRLRAN